MPASPMDYEEFGGEYRAERTRLMRKRLVWYLGVSNAFNLIGLFLSGLTVALGETGFFDTVTRLQESGAGQAEYSVNRVTLWGGFLLSVPGAVFYLWALIRVLGRPIEREAGLRLVYWLIVLPTVLGLIGSLVIAQVGSTIMGTSGDADAFSQGIGWGGALAVVRSHFFACLFLPWTPRESVRPMLPLLVLNGLIASYTLWGSWDEIGILVGLSVVSITPGVALCWLKQSRFTKRFIDRSLRSAYGELRFELSAARQIHDAMFPDPVTEGPIRVDYRYEPMRQIGGDYVFVRRSEHAVDVVLIDVTGHGVGAALTVNRLHGEVSRQLAERPDCGPGELLRGLNRYLHITLARHSVYATAFCCRVETESDELRYASAGHPPAYIVGQERACERLDSTSYLLGVVGVDDFDAGEKSQRLAEGDRLIAYTDGATEAMDGEGRQFRIAGIESTLDGLRSARGTPAQPGSWLAAIVAAVEQHRAGAATDDTLIVEVQRASLQEAPRPPFRVQCPNMLSEWAACAGAHHFLMGLQIDRPGSGVDTWTWPRPATTPPASPHGPHPACGCRTSSRSL